MRPIFVVLRENGNECGILEGGPRRFGLSPSSGQSGGENAPFSANSRGKAKKTPKIRLPRKNPPLFHPLLDSQSWQPVPELPSCGRNFVPRIIV